MSKKPVDIEMFVDVSCPWCFGSLTTMRRVFDAFSAHPEAAPINLQWRFMRLHGDLPIPALSFREYVAQWATDDAAVTKMQAGIIEYATSVGVRVDFERTSHVHDPFLAHRLLAMVRDDNAPELPSLWHLSFAIASANHTRGVDITSHVALREAVEVSGLTLPDGIWKRLGDAADHEDATRADWHRAQSINLDGVPRLFVNDTIVPTWHGYEDAYERLAPHVGL